MTPRICNDGALVPDAAKFRGPSSVYAGGICRGRLIGEGDVDWIALDYAVAGGRVLRDDGAYGGDRMRDGFGGG